MPRTGTLFGSFKIFFKVSRDACRKTEECSSVASPNAANEPDDASSTCTTSSVHLTSKYLSKDFQNGSNTLSLPGTQPKGFQRKLFSRSFFPPRSPLSISEATICHSISDPSENPSNRTRAPTRDSNGRPCHNSLRHAVKSSRLIMATREGDGSAPSSANSTPYATYDSSRRCLSLDIPAIALSSPAALTPFPSLWPNVLAGADMNAQAKSPGMQSPSIVPAFDVPGTESPPLLPSLLVPPANPQSDTTLLAMCPGVPAAMRRRQWCVEDYDVSRKLYKGSTSTVYKATCRRSGLPVALKVYFLSKVPKNVIHMIIREIKIHVELVHKHIVTLYAAFAAQKRLVLVQEYAGRGDLHGLYRSLNRRMTEAQLTHLVLAPFMEALAYLHYKGICHRDIKPENILFTNDWRLMIADFGVSIDLNQERAVTRAGTLEYMAPEVERCPLKMLPEENKENPDLAYTTAVDIWAAGVLAYELLVGFAPFIGDQPFQISATATKGTDDWDGNLGGAVQAARKVVNFPSFISAHGRDFIRLALAERPEERPTALQLSRHPWLAAAMQQRNYGNAYGAGA
ncbi:hypothetical protein Vretifemale_14603 [Volvox reticuliferus]|uniref:Protein kinase domain-containing protein n=3 Tax=Volvox reticuliferus TaxID=1737510 RepID=A0A8J4FU83_9CHLO|nr:hypothetical protein Vretifemale_14603 [Volvox reticuliferus]